MQHKAPLIPSLCNNERDHINDAIGNLISTGAVTECQPCEGQFISSFFLRQKPNGKMRFILNLKQLNKFIDTEHFKIEDLRTAVKLISKNCYMASLDLKDAYFFVKIHPSSRKYLRFNWDNKTYEFNAMPFGLSTAPYLFTKIMKPVVKLLRSAGYLSTIYLDDLFLLGRTYRECLENIHMTKKLLISLGFIINEAKSNLVPSTTCKFLGFLLNSNKMQVTLPDDKKTRVKSELKNFMALKRCKIRKFAQIVGLLISICPATEYGLLYTKQLERSKFLSLNGSDDYDKYMNISSSLLPDLQWWLKAIENSASSIKHDSYVIEIFSDASTTGWGASCNGETASGQWSETERTKHINFLELLAAFIALKIFAKQLTNCQILLRVDNSTAISYINRMGGIQFPHLTQVAKDIWQWCENRKLFIFASYIKSADNKVADFESRRVHPDIEWELSNSAYQKIIAKFGTPQIDLFASRINNKCAKYVSWNRDPDAWAINAFTINWTDYYFYAFPPFSIILKTLRKIITDKATGIMIVPVWPSQPWYPVFTQLLVSNMIHVKANEHMISSHSRDDRKIQSNLILAAGMLSGRRYWSEVHRSPL